MRVLIGVYLAIFFLGAGLSSYSDELYVQRSPITPYQANLHNAKSSGADSFACPQGEYSTSVSSPDNMEEYITMGNQCEPSPSVKAKIDSSMDTSSKDNSSSKSAEELTLLPNPEVEFVEEYMLTFDGNKSRDTIFYGGVVPFVALPDAELSTEDRFFNDESFSFFLYFKRKF